MSTKTNDTLMLQEFSNKNLQSISFKGKNVANARFDGADLRGANFSGANLTNSDFTHVKTGIPPLHKIFIFLGALIVSLVSGYIAMLAGKTIQRMMASGDNNIKNAGILSMVIIIMFMLFSMWKGVGKAIQTLFIPAAVLAIVVATVAYVSGLGTGMGMVYLVLALLLVAVMFVIGTIARTSAGTLSNILFTVVALSGGVFSKSVGGGLGTAIMALACMVISKRALAGAKGFEVLHQIGAYITSTFGTSFRNARLADANFTGAKINHCDFSGADISTVNWGDAKKRHCIMEADVTIIKKDKENK